MSCPLPIDWLDYLEGLPWSEGERHLADCPSCRATVHQLELADGWHGDDSPVVVPRGSNTWPTVDIAKLDVGQLWFTRPDFRSNGFGYQDQHSVPILVMNVANGPRGTWVEMAPVWTDTDNATNTDLVLREGDSTLGCELRVLFRLQGWLAADQLDRAVGSLSADGLALFNQAIRGEADIQHFGSALDGADDPRLAEPFWIEPAIRQAQSYRLFLGGRAVTTEGRP